MTGRPLRERLLEGAELGAPTGCWLWARSVDSKGYGVIGVGSRNHRAHRAAWMAWKGAIPGRLHVLHSCDTPPCINPAHLFLGTDLDNARDRERKGRGGDHRGVRHGRAKMESAQVIAILRRLGAGGSISDIAAEAGVSYSAIWRLKQGEAWQEERDAVRRA